MPFYVSKFIGTGVLENGIEDPFRPIVADYTDVWNAIDLRADSTLVDGWCLVWALNAISPLPTGVLLIAANPDDVLQSAVRNSINTNLGTSLPVGVTFRQAVRQIMTTEARTDGSKWAPLVVDNSGRLRVFLGDYVDVW